MSSTHTTKLIPKCYDRKIDERRKEEDEVRRKKEELQRGKVDHRDGTSTSCTEDGAMDGRHQTGRRTVANVDCCIRG